MRVVDLLEHLGGDHRRPVGRIDQEELLLGADARHARLEEVFVEHPLEGPHLGDQGLHEDLKLRRIALLPDFVLTHASIR